MEQAEFALALQHDSSFPGWLNFRFFGETPLIERTGRNHERIVGNAFAIFTLQLICFNLNTDNRERLTFFWNCWWLDLRSKPS